MAGQAGNRYCIDTSSIIHWYVEYYSPEILPTSPSALTTWLRPEDFALQKPSGTIKPGDDLPEWSKVQTDLFIDENEDVQREVKRFDGHLSQPAKALERYQWS